MKKYPLKLLELFTEDILEKTYEKSFLPGEVISFLEDDRCFFILEGNLIGTKYAGKKPIYFPRILKKGELCGHYSYIMDMNINWEIKSLTKSKVLIIPDKLLRETILEDTFLYKRLVKIQTLNLEYGVNFYFLQSQVDNKAAYAYFLMVNSVEGVFSYIKHEYIYRLLNISRTSYHKIEKEFIENGYIRKEHKKIIIIKPDRLIDFFKDYIIFKEDL